MDRYNGPAKITGGGSYIADHEVGGEVLNFKESRGRCFGWARTANDIGVDLHRLSPHRKWMQGGSLDGVDVVFFATHPKGGQVVVGYYKGATVLHRTCRSRPGKIPGMSKAFPMHLCEVAASDAFLVPETQRTFNVPSPRSAGKGFPGQSNVWYPNVGKSKSVAKFARALREYLLTLSGSVSDGVAENHLRAPGLERKFDSALIAEVETCATTAVRQYFQGLGYRVMSVERDNVGWDFEARKGSELLRLEVKGRSISELRFELTPNEYAKLQEHSDTYRLCVVCDALDSPEIYVLQPRQDGSLWKVESENREIVVDLRLQVGAIGVLVRGLD